MQVRVSKDAAIELEKAASWYEQEVTGLGEQLINAFEEAGTLLIEPNPPLVPVPYESARSRARQIILHRFPYSLITVENEDQIIVIALAHHRRIPAIGVIGSTHNAEHSGGPSGTSGGQRPRTGASCYWPGAQQSDPC